MNPKDYFIVRKMESVQLDLKAVMDYLTAVWPPADTGTQEIAKKYYHRFNNNQSRRKKRGNPLIEE